MINFYKKHKNRKSDFEICEDSLTSTVFEILSLIPHNGLWKVLSEAAGIKDISCPEDFLDIEFWPKWMPQGTLNTNYVEPDVFIRYKNLDVIIEAKINDSNPQTDYQWQNEIEAYKNHYQGENKRWILIAVDGNNGEFKKIENCDNLKMPNFNGIYRTDWQMIIDVVNKCTYVSNPIKDYFNKAISLHGYAYYEPMIKFFEDWSRLLNNTLSSAKFNKAYDSWNNKLL